MTGKDSYKVTDDFSSRRFNETDFGGIYFNSPSEVRTPGSIKELAKILSEYHKRGVPVTIRNTGHSVNGQTLTSGVQINLSGINHVSFDKSKMIVTAGAGVDWDTILQTISFPEYCPPIFPNNPGQKIHMTGNASVGGIGHSSAKVGGLWNHIKRITLVTMTGKIISCSKNEHPDYFRFALGGFGRIGVIAEADLAIEKSKSHILGLGLVYHNLETLRDQITLATEDPVMSSVGTAEYVPNGLIKGLHAEMGVLGLVADVDPDQDISEILHHVKSIYSEDIILGFTFDDDPRRVVKVEMSYTITPKRNYVYCYPESKLDHHLDLRHPWTDPVVPESKYPQLVRGCNDIIRKYGMGKYLRKQTHLDEFDHIPSYISYLAKKTRLEEQGFFPLSLAMKDAKRYTIGLAIEAAVPSSDLEQAIEMVNEINDFTYALGGKTYLFSHHNLSKEQIIQHYGREVLKQWNAIKKELDPKHLLNRGVIEHVDEI